MHPEFEADAQRPGDSHERLILRYRPRGSSEDRFRCALRRDCGRRRCAGAPL